jgi:PKD repeat protein
MSGMGCGSGGGGRIFTLVNNTISRNTAGRISGLFISCLHDNDLTNIYNNIIWDNVANENKWQDISIWNDGDGNEISSIVNLFNNDFDQSAAGTYIQIPFPIDPSNLNNINPEFVDPDPPNDDYHLSERSPCINEGSGVPELPATDKDGFPRIVGRSVDIGAYEYQGFVEPVAAFSAFPLSGVAPLSVNFTDGSTGTIDTWDWAFGDGDSSSERNPAHIYEVQGTYSVSLTATGDSVSDTETMIDYITVISPDAPDLSGGCKEFHSYEFGQRIVAKVQVINTGIRRVVGPR